MRGWHFPVEIDSKTGKIKTTGLEEDIKQSILILLNTLKGERIRHYSYGCNLNNFMFEPISYTLAENIKKEVYDSISYWEKRITDIVIEVFRFDEYQTKLLINIQYLIKENNIKDEINYDYDLYKT